MPTNRPEVSVVIVNWNTRDLLLNCVASVIENTQAIFHEIIVVDNASSDSSVEAVRREFPSVKLIASKANLGFAAGNNLGLKSAKGNFVLFLNPDTVVKPNSLSVLVAFIREHEEVGIVGPKLVGRDGKLQISSFGVFPSLTEQAMRTLRVWRVMPRSVIARRFHVEPQGSESWTYTEHILGACMLARKKLIDDLGGFDEGYFLFLEETDLCYRARRLGWKIAYVPGVEIIHLGEQSMQSMLDRTGGMYIRSYNRFCRRRGMGFLRMAAANGLLVVDVLTGAAFELLRTGSFKRACLPLGGLYYGYMADPRNRNGGIPE